MMMRGFAILLMMIESLGTVLPTHEVNAPPPKSFGGSQTGRGTKSVFGHGGRLGNLETPIRKKRGEPNICLHPTLLSVSAADFHVVPNISQVRSVLRVTLTYHYCLLLPLSVHPTHGHGANNIVCFCL